ncbi:hypothetical protein [Streptomyces sp. NBC_01431]|uniref:hypothetical protein n=1 Tax=Streptomyces sp. NBC_01431 TaxID=2903863 RepID=UPI002E36CC3D|nr:hypothetical protein [Streptomyces sp. NBC_01431]
MTWLIAAGLHPQANATTLAVARDLTARMDYDSGHARYCLLETAARLGVHEATVKRHVAVLRELGALVWVVHGTRANIRRALGMPGYAATATVYAAVIPASYDNAIGNHIVGSGYDARIIVGQRNSRGPVSNVAGEGPSSEVCAPPSLSLVKEDGQVQVVGGCEDTSRTRASRRTAPVPQQKASSNIQESQRRTAAQVARCVWIARQVRARVNWTQTARLRRLEFVLRPLTDAGLDVHEIVAELNSWMLAWRPADPASYIRATLVRHASREAEERAALAEEQVLEAAATAPNAAFTEAVRTLRVKESAESAPAEETTLSGAERVDLQAIGMQHPSLVVQYLEMAGEQAAVELYGRLMVDGALAKTGRAAQVSLHG